MPPSQITLRHSVSFGRDEISFALRRSNRKTLSISVNPDLSIVVTAPKSADLDSVKRRIRKRAKWILAQQNFFEAFLPPASPRRFVSGETHYYLGRQYRLKITKSDNEGVRLVGAYIEINQNGDRSKSRIKELLDEWLLSRARIRFAKGVENCHYKLRKLELPLPALRLRRMTKRWGSCTRQAI